MATTMRCVAPTARIGGRVALKAPSQTKLFGLGVPKAGRRAQQFKAMAYKITLKTPSGDEEIECDGARCCCAVLRTISCFITFSIH